MKANGYKLPAEWQPQARVWFAWPVRDDLWPGCLSSVRSSLIDLYKLCAQYQKVAILCPHHAQGHLRKALKGYLKQETIVLFDYETDDIWIRDFGPIFLKEPSNETLAVTDWVFNAWGEKFKEYAKDNRVPEWISTSISRGEDRQSIYQKYPHVLEGGAIETNGQGLICTTNSVLNNPNRLPKGEAFTSGEAFARDETFCWDETFKEAFNTQAVFWFKFGLIGDDTDGHIDNLLRFTPSKTILYAATEDQGNVNYKALKQVEKQLEGYLKEGLHAYGIRALPLPDAIYHEGVILAASYANYLVLNGAVIVPTFGQEKDGMALSIIAECFPEREVIGFNCSDIIREGGALHCLSLNQPSVSPSSSS